MPNLENINNECIKILNNELLGGENNSEYEACKIFYKLVEDDSKEHNCLGCQFADLHQLFVVNLSSLNAKNLTPEFYFITYIFWLYQNVERIYEIFEILNKDSANSMLRIYFEKNFIFTKRIKRWTNFIKHPKAFQFAHHPIYIYESDKINLPKDAIVLDTSQIEKYYAGGSKNKELYKKVGNKKNVFVVLPDLIEITKGFCREFKLFSSFICNNEMIAEYLKEKSTIDNYYDDETE